MQNRVPKKRRVSILKSFLCVLFVAGSAIFVTRVYQGIGRSEQKENLRPVALLEGVGFYLLVNSEGYLLGEKAHRESPFPVIRGIDEKRIKEGEQGERSRLVQILSFLESLRQVSPGMPGWEDLEVDAREQLLVMGGWRIRFGTDSPVARWKDFVKVKEDVTRRGFSPAEVDLRFPGQVVVRFNRAREERR